MTRDSKGFWQAPFAGFVHDFAVPLRKRADSRKRVGPYCQRPSQPGSGVGFYMESGAFRMARHGARISLRIEEAGPRGWRALYAYRFNDHGDAMVPIIARLPKGRGFLAGWTMGEGMCAELASAIYQDEDEARRAAHIEAEHAADRECDFEAEEAERLQREEEEAEAKAESLAAFDREMASALI